MDVSRGDLNLKDFSFDLSFTSNSSIIYFFIKTKRKLKYLLKERFIKEMNLLKPNQILYKTCSNNGELKLNN